MAKEFWISDDVIEEAARQVRDLFRDYQPEIDKIYGNVDPDKKMKINFPVEFTPMDNGQVFVRAHIGWTNNFKDHAEGKPAGGKQQTFDDINFDASASEFPETIQ